MDNNDKFNQEIAMAFAERTIRRLWILCIILILCLIGMTFYMNQFDFTETTQEVTQDVDTGEGNIDSVIGIGSNYGENQTNSETSN